MANSIFPKIKDYSTAIAGVLMSIAAVATAISVYYRPSENKKYEAEINSLQEKMSQLNVQQYETQLKFNSMLEWKSKLESAARVDAELLSSRESILYRNITKRYGKSVANYIIEQRKKIDDNEK